MKQNKARGLALFLLTASLLAVALACRVEAPKIILENEPTLAPTVAITQVVTEVVTATPLPPTATLPPSPTPTSPPLPTATWDPLSAPIYYPLEDCAASRLKVGGKAFVANGGEVGIRYGQDIHYDSVATTAQMGDVLDITAGPYCSWGWIIWMVQTKDGFVGFIPEGNGETYWLLPVAP
jgi:hypothetical protein